MRRRFFIIVFIFLFFSILTVSFLQVFFFENERLRFLDQRLEAIASTLIASGLSMDLIDNLESTDDLIHDLLGEERVDQIINIYSLEGDILAQNYTGTNFPLEFNPSERRQTYQVKDRTVRVLNIRSNQLLIQVATLMPTPLSRSNFKNIRFLGFIGGVFVLLVIIAYLSSGVLFHPLRKLTVEFKAMSHLLEKKMGQPLTGFVLGSELKRLSQSHDKTKDDFQILCEEIRVFLNNLEVYTKSFHTQMAILTHELKTPLTLLQNFLSEMNLHLNKEKSLDRVKELIHQSRMEISNMVELINNYLQWSVLSSSPSQPQAIYALKVSSVLHKLVHDLNILGHQRIRLEFVEDPTVFVLPEHLQQLFSNLLGNALNYSPENTEVLCLVEKDRILIQDKGPGISKEVLKHLGEPFNRGSSGVLQNMERKSSGLGLAWVHSLCEKYHWKLIIDSSTQGTRVEIQWGLESV